MRRLRLLLAFSLLLLTVLLLVGANISSRTGPAAASGSATASGGVSAISAGGNKTCALKDGGVWCWGGEPGDLETGNLGLTPTAVSGLTSDVTAISAGFDHTCAITSVSDVKCFGENDHGELGDGENNGPQLCLFGVACSFTPLEVIGLNNSTEISVGGGHTCATNNLGDAKCWGWNFAGQLGDGTQTGPQWCGPAATPDLQGYQRDTRRCLSRGERSLGEW